MLYIEKTFAPMSSPFRSSIQNKSMKIWFKSAFRHSNCRSWSIILWNMNHRLGYIESFRDFHFKGQIFNIFKLCKAGLLQRKED